MSAANPKPTADLSYLFGGIDADAVANRMKAIATDSCEKLLLASGPPNMDYELLDLCGDALHYAKAANNAYGSRTKSPGWDAPDQAAWSARDKELMAEYYSNNHEVTIRLRRAKKMKATTSAGIYAKALLVRISKTGATELAISLAVDLVECEALRTTLWPTGKVTA